MGAPSVAPSAPPPSELESLLGTYELPQNSQHQLQFHQLALQIAHNLNFQHSWTDVRIHRGSRGKDENLTVLPRPMISGIPRQRLYVHPDEQIELLQKQKHEGKTGMPDLPREREWVLPSHLREKWTLRMFGEVFDALSLVPSMQDGEALFEGAEKPFRTNNILTGDEDVEVDNIEPKDPGETNHWRVSQPKRLLLATLDDDSTIVYYIVHDGIVKPRQN